MEENKSYFEQNPFNMDRDDVPMDEENFGESASFSYSIDNTNSGVIEGRTDFDSKPSNDPYSENFNPAELIQSNQVYNNLLGGCAKFDLPSLNPGTSEDVEEKHVKDHFMAGGDKEAKNDRYVPQTSN
jgi:hypothetical protein